MKKLLTLILLFAGAVQAQVTPTLPSGATSYSSQIYRKIAGTDTTYYTGASGKGFLKLAGYADVLRLQDSLAGKLSRPELQDSLKKFSKNPQSGITVVDMHYGILRGRGFSITSSEGINTYNVSTGASAGGLTVELVSNSSNENSLPLAQENLIAYKGANNEWYSAKIAGVSGTTLTLGSPLEVDLLAGTGNVSTFYDNESHPNAYGYYAIADYTLRTAKTQFLIESRFDINTGFGGGSVAATPNNSINNTGSTTTFAKTVTCPDGLTSGIEATFTITGTGAHLLKFVVNTLGNDVKASLTYNGITVDTIFNHNEPLRFNLPFYVSSDLTSVNVKFSAVNDGGAFIINESVPILRASAVAPDFNSGKHVLLGDSWFAQYYLDLRIRERLPNATIVNAGVGGNTAQQIINRFDEDVANENPDVVWLIVGTNDYFQNVTLDQFSYNINKLKGLVASIGAHLVMFTPSVGSAELDTTNFKLSRQYANFAKYYDEDLGAVIQSPDTSIYQTVSNFFPKADTRYLTIVDASNNYFPKTGGMLSGDVVNFNTNWGHFGNFTDTYTGSAYLQSGGGSDAFGGGIILRGHSHPSNPGWVTAGISLGSGGKFSVNNSGIGGGTDVFTVDATGIVYMYGIPATSAGTYDILTRNTSTGVVEKSSVLPSGVTAPTPTAGDNSTKVATTAYVDNAVSGIASVTSGVYTPTFTNAINIDASSLVASASYMKINNIITVSFKVNIDPTTATSATLYFSLPALGSSSSSASSGAVTSNGVGYGTTQYQSTTQGQASLTPTLTSQQTFTVTYTYSL